MNSSMDEAEMLYNEGVRAIRERRDFVDGQRLLRESLKVNPYNDQAWVLLAQAIDDPARKLKYVENALKANPQNTRAISLRQKLLSQSAVQEPAQPGKTQAKATESAAVTGSDDTRLGRLLIKVGVNKSLQTKRIVLLLVLVPLTLVFIYAAAQEDGANGRNFWLAFAGVTGVIALATLIFLLDHLNQMIGVYDQGIVILKSGKERVYRWSAFTALTVQDISFRYRYSMIPVYKYTRYSVKLFDQKRVVINLTNEMDQFRLVGDLVMKLTGPEMTKRALNALKSGETLQFGAIQADREGLRRGRKQVAWRSLSQWDVRQGWLNIYSGNFQAMRHHTARMKNPHVLMNLMDQVGKHGL